MHFYHSRHLGTGASAKLLQPLNELDELPVPGAARLPCLVAGDPEVHAVEVAEGNVGHVIGIVARVEHFDERKPWIFFWGVRNTVSRCLY